MVGGGTEPSRAVIDSLTAERKIELNAIVQRADTWRARQPPLTLPDSGH
jgi:hypothetical protein